MLRILAFAEAVAAFVADGCLTVDRDEYETRLRICESCTRRAGLKCGLCGCFIHVKARGRVFQCPDDPPRWLAAPKRDESVNTLEARQSEDHGAEQHGHH